MRGARTSLPVVLLVLVPVAAAGGIWAATALVTEGADPSPPRRTVVQPGRWSVSYPTTTQAASTPWVVGPAPDGADPDGNGLDARGCPYPNPFPDIVSDQDYAIASADRDPRVLRCSVDRRPH
ncbi:MAG TPA: hypothetical protein VI248_18965 [Kineosporiaceae bacterium]